MKLTLTIANRVVLLGLIPLVLLLTVLLGSFWAANAKDRLFNQLYDEHLAILADVMRPQKILQQQGLTQLQQYRTGWASAEGTVQSVTALLTEAEQHWQAFSAKRVAKSAADAEVFSELDKAFAQAVKHYQEWLSYAGTDALLIRILNESTINNEVALKINPFTEQAEQFIQQQIATAAVVRDRAADFTQRMVQFYVYGGLLLTLVVLFLMWQTRRAVNQPLRGLRDLLLQLEQQADLTLRADEQGRDEIAEAARALNQMLQRFAALLMQLGASSQLLTSQAHHVQQVSEQVNAGAGLQATQADQLSLAVEEMSAAVRQVIADTEAALTTAAAAQQLCQQGTKVTSQNMQSTELLAQKMVQASSIIGTLQQDSAKISGVLEVIGKISEQTNLLALNAAIEAARAGEAGRGFSVVADEVRTLSGNTKAATESIRQMISTLQAQANHAVAAIEQAAGQAEHSVEHARITEQVFRDIASEVTQLAAFNQQISQATDEQQQVTNRFISGISELHSASQQLHDGATSSAQASEQLSAVAAQLNAGWQQFRVS
ncbi:chemotaxis transducer [Alishewanella longhuensis]|uniref:Chemotaxis transducer n=1 Tax=Alishewanella longhuensis TaxID=1091037 RepID=A0ABQ3KZC1_9ALTE|nr:methyl-accepting chemotaxis protein [Alishewanella longhuensis]GHG66079.1 chemotaxis transducer [Alishewanella longhuensis]